MGAQIGGTRVGGQPQDYGSDHGSPSRLPREALLPPLLPQDPGTDFGPSGEDAVDHSGIRQPK